MRNKFLFYTCLLLGIAAFPRTAAQPAGAGQELHDLLATLVNGDNYTYDVTITSRLSGSAREQQVLHMHNYQSRQSVIVYSRSEEALLFICAQGQLRVNPRQRSAYYAQYPADPAARQQIREQLLRQASASLIDTFLLAGAAVTGRTTARGITTWKLAYEPGSPLTGCTIDADPQRGAIVRIAYDLERPVAGAGQGSAPGAVMRQHVEMAHYVQQVPAEVTRLLGEAGDIKAYLERTCKGYNIEKINL